MPSRYNRATCGLGQHHGPPASPAISRVSGRE